MAKAKKKEPEQDVQESVVDESANDTAATAIRNEDAIALRSKTLVGDVRDAILDTIKHEKENKAWPQMTEAQQRDCIDRCTGAAERLIREIVDIVATQGFEHTKAEIDRWKVKGRQVVLTLKSSATEQNILSLLGASGNYVTLTFANDDAFDEDRTPCSPDPDKPELGLPDDDDDADDESVSGYESEHGSIVDDRSDIWDDEESN
ncbi:MAG: hypothetical protein GC149_20440 [Gammaproteobacteria bacterium]|nr:hypothetical protein [Gammaproteobacteria bacterium]